MNRLNEFKIIMKKENSNKFFVSHENISLFKEKMLNQKIRWYVLDSLMYDISSFISNAKNENNIIGLDDLTTLGFLHLSIDDFIEEQYCNLHSEIFHDQF
jgi:hypothetical protein